jgi:ribonucleotide monophosphatase NagD (HAD superfamily)
MAMDDMGKSEKQVAMIGDDVLTDVQGAQKMGMKGILVKTGKYREDVVARSGVTPDLVLESLAQLVDHLKF